MGKIRFGRVKGESVGVPVHIGASEKFYSKSGRFVTNDGSGRMELSDENDTYLSGWIEEASPSGLTASSTEGASVFTMYSGLDDVFRMPLIYDGVTYDRNYSYALDGETCDIKVLNGIQYCNVSASAVDNVRIRGGQAASAAAADGGVTGITYGDGYVDVSLVEGKMYYNNVGVE